ncbi:GNAT family N-acetyltransferase [Pseudorhodoferax sp.]|uniref:GNAT family N-acetyltransferase n=1 Tax=Pseudorhodoferax sp. TaxID=1993553 RepID=UPI002DD653E0|nr:GNAT family N-acetyltransferase [Pseudorhodoferax sp.]
MDAALGILNTALESDPTLRWCLSADSRGYDERRLSYLGSYLRFHHLASMPALGLWSQGVLVGVSYFTPASHSFEPELYSSLGQSIREGCGDEALSKIQVLLDAVESELPARDVARIEFIAVAPNEQGSGLGSQLLTATLVRLASNEGHTKVCLETAEKRNLPFYLRHGFKNHVTVKLPNLEQYLLNLDTTDDSPIFHSSRQPTSTAEFIR